MIPFGILGITGDQFYLKGIKEQNLLYLIIAKSVFPFEKELLVGPGHLYLISQTINLEAKNEIKDALKYDPYSAQFLSVYAQYLNIFNDKKEALIYLEKLKLISPNSQMTKIVTERFKEQRKD